MQTHAKRQLPANLALAIAAFDKPATRYPANARAIRSGQLARADQYAVRARGYNVNPE